MRTYISLEANPDPLLVASLPPTSGNAVNLATVTVAATPTGELDRLNIRFLDPLSPGGLNALVSTLPPLATAVLQLGELPDTFGDYRMPPAAILKASDRFPPSTTGDDTILIAWVDETTGFNAELNLPDDPATHIGANLLTRSLMQAIATTAHRHKRLLDPEAQTILDQYDECVQ